MKIMLLVLSLFLFNQFNASFSWVVAMFAAYVASIIASVISKVMEK